MSKEIIDLQIWASGFFLTELLTPELLDGSWEEFNNFISDHTAEPFEEFGCGEVWDLIHSLAMYTHSTERYGL